MYRGKNLTTNILSFEINKMIQNHCILLGDLVLCKKIIEKESEQYNKTLESHWAHMIIHGTLHLLGYDHQTHQEAYKMEKTENEIMLLLNYPKPNT